MKKNWRTCQAWILAVSLGVSSLSGLGWQTEEAQAQDTLTAQEEEQTPYWQRENNAPLFYGATQITMPVGMMKEFDIDDSRFRLFARDYEDGDLTPQIECTGEVDPMTVGDYELRYRVEDSAGETVSLTVPVHVRKWAEYEDSASDKEYTVYLKETEKPQESEAPQISGEPQESEAPQISGEPQVSEEPQISGEPQVSEEPQISREPQVSEEPQISGEPQVSEEPQISGEPQVSEEPQISGEPQVSEAPQISGEPQVSEEPQISGEPQVSETPQISDGPQTSDEPQSGESSLSSRTGKQEIVEKTVSGYRFTYQVERSIYELPSDYYQWSRDVKRADKEDRQMLGIYLPKGSSFTVSNHRTIHDMRFDLLTNDSELDSNYWLDCGERMAMTYTNEHDCSSVPFAQTYHNSIYSNSGDDWNQTSLYDLEYDVDTPALAYYHYKDDEQSFRQNWRDSGMDYGVLEGEALTMLVPAADEPYMTGVVHNNFKTLDSYLEHYLSIVTHYKKWLGISTKPQDVRDLCVDSRTFIRADVHGAGLAAYYSGQESTSYPKSWISFNGANVKMFFEMGWMELHEIGHGYQGDFNGNGDMNLGEVTNNILAHYYQTDKTLFPFDDCWIGGSPKEIEGKLFKNLDSVDQFKDAYFETRLYFFVQLFDHFEGVDTYAKIRTWHRHNTTRTNGIGTQEILARAMADIYHVNIIPYLEAWKIDVDSAWAEDIEVQGYPKLYMMDQVLNEDGCEKIREYRAAHPSYEFHDYLTGEDVNAEYSDATLVHQIVTDQDIAKVIPSGTESLTVQCQKDDISAVAGQTARLKGGNTTYTAEIQSDGTAVFTGVRPGIYQLQMPLDYGLTQSVPMICLEQTQSGVHDKYSYKYKIQMIEEKYSSKQCGGIVSSLNSLYREFNNNALFKKSPYYKLDVRQKFMSNFYQLPGELKQEWKDRAAQVNPELNYLEAPTSVTLTEKDEWDKEYLKSYFREHVWYLGREWNGEPDGNLILSVESHSQEGNYMIPYEYTMSNGNEIYGYIEIQYDTKEPEATPSKEPEQTQPAQTGAPVEPTPGVTEPSASAMPSQTPDVTTAPAVSEPPAADKTNAPAATSTPDATAQPQEPSPTTYPWMMPQPLPTEAPQAEPIYDDDQDSIAVISGLRRIGRRKLRVRISTANATVTAYHKQSSGKKKVKAVCRGKQVTITCKKNWKKGDVLVLILKKDGYMTSRVKLKG